MDHNYHLGGGIEQIPFSVGHGTQERILTAYCEDLENEGRSISEWLDIRCTAAALMDEDLKRYALHSVGAFLWLMPYWKGNASNLFLESFNPYRYGRQGIK